MKTLLFKTNDSKSVEALAQYLEYLNAMNKGEVKEYIIEIKKNRPIRSVSANRYYRAILLCIAGASGNTDDELHEYYKKKFNGKFVIDEQIGQTTSNMDTAEFSVYVKKVKDHGEKQFNFRIPDPKDRHYAVWEQISKDKYNAMFSAID
jgi:hypothetical protein